MTSAARPPATAAQTTTARRRIVGLAIALFFAAGIVFNAQHLYYNGTPSEPVGAYWITNDQPSTGKIALVCMSPELIAFAEAHNWNEPTDSQSPCYHHSAPLLKEIWGVAGDRVHVDHRGVSINDRLIPHTEPLATSDDGSAIPHPHDITLSPNTVAAGSTAPYSFDSRYAGELKIIHTARLLLKDPFVHGNAADARPPN